MNFNNYMKKKAFSLIELSIVLLIIGIIITGITKSSVLVNSFRLSNAASQTKSSPVNSIPNLNGWWETTLPTSFTEQESQTSQLLSTWNDINPQSSTKNNASSSSVNRPTYQEGALNSLPTVRFDGSNDYFTLPDGTIPYNDANYTIFFVMKPTNVNCFCSFLGSGDFATNNRSNAFRFDNSGNLKNYWWFVDINTTNSPITVNNPYILTFSYDNSVGRKIFVNGVLNVSDTTKNRNSTAQNNFLGRALSTDPYFAGDLGEIIIFERNLKTEERQSVEGYLSKKWNIAI
jgi:prepilin-type N-terminal cleavage/methylation domain-containing protein